MALANSHASEKHKFRVLRSNSPGFEWWIELPERLDLTWRNPPRKMLRREFAWGDRALTAAVNSISERAAIWMFGQCRVKGSPDPLAYTASGAQVLGSGASKDGSPIDDWGLAPPTVIYGEPLPLLTPIAGQIL